MQQKSNNDQRSDRRGDRSPDDGRRNLDDRRGDRSLDDGRYRRYMDGGTDRRERYTDGTDRRERYMDGGMDRSLYDRRGDRYLDNNKRPSQRDEQGRNHNSTDNPNRTKTTNGAVDHKPNYKLSGALVKDQLSLGGVVLKYSEPPEARTPTVKYRLYVYKNGKEKSIIKIDKQSCYLIGKESISDIILEHESCSKQHAALQYRMMDGQVKLYIIDLKSANGTFLNKKPVPQKRFVELRNSDILGFGASSREYVLIQDD